jgi:hypothetical protein
VVVPYCAETYPSLPPGPRHQEAVDAASGGGIDPQAALLDEPRLRLRLGLIFDALARHPGCSLPQALGSWAATKATYRFFAHPATSVANLLPALTLPAVRSACSLPPPPPGDRFAAVRVIHDSTTFNFSHLLAAVGLGFINDSEKARGLHLHSSLILSPQGALLGIAHLHFWVREQFRELSADQIKRLPIEEKESFKWLLGVRAAVAAFADVAGKAVRLIHAMDREGDVHEVFAEIRRLRQDAVIRCCQDRRVQSRKGQPIRSSKEHVAARPVLGRACLRVPTRLGRTRLAQVEVRSVQVRLAPEGSKHKGRKPLKLWLIEIRETSTPPAGETAARWWLWTTLPAKALEQALEVLSIYRSRWRLEEYHRAMKATGCNVEGMRLQGGEALMKAITLQAQVAARVVQMRDGVKQSGQANCRGCFEEEEWKTLWAWQHKRAWRAEDGAPTLEQVVRWLGRLGGHLGRKGDGLPGAEVLGRGLFALALLMQGRELGKAEAQAEQPSPSQQAASGQTTRAGPAAPPSSSHQHPRG